MTGELRLSLYRFFVFVSTFFVFEICQNKKLGKSKIENKM